jgi:AbiV family abortive infection protein
VSKRESLTDLEKGARACYDNASRLLQDAEFLFYNRSYLSCFLLSELSLEEMSKGFRLLEKYSKKEEFLKDEWESLTGKGRNSHLNKLKYVMEADDKWLEEVVKSIGTNYEELLKNLIKQFPWAKSVQDYRQRIAQEYYNFRIDTLYVDFDFGMNKWKEPSKHNVVDDPGFYLQSLTRAKHILSVLGAELVKTRGK